MALLLGGSVILVSGVLLSRVSHAAQDLLDETSECLGEDVSLTSNIGGAYFSIANRTKEVELSRIQKLAHVEIIRLQSRVEILCDVVSALAASFPVSTPTTLCNATAFNNSFRVALRVMAEMTVGEIEVLTFFFQNATFSNIQFAVTFLRNGTSDVFVTFACTDTLGGQVSFLSAFGWKVNSFGITTATPAECIRSETEEHTKALLERRINAKFGSEISFPLSTCRRTSILLVCGDSALGASFCVSSSDSFYRLAATFAQNVDGRLSLWASDNRLALKGSLSFFIDTKRNATIFAPLRNGTASISALTGTGSVTMPSWEILDDLSVAVARVVLQNGSRSYSPADVVEVQTSNARVKLLVETVPLRCCREVVVVHVTPIQSLFLMRDHARQKVSDTVTTVRYTAYTTSLALIFATIVALCVSAYALWRIVMRTNGDFHDLMWNIDCVGSMKLEDAISFGEGGSLSDTREILELQLASNAMNLRLRDFRKYLPMTIYAPPPEELAQELQPQSVQDAPLSNHASPTHQAFMTAESDDGASIAEQSSVLAALNFGLRVRRASILTVSLVGFLRLSQDSISEAHSLSQLFLHIVLNVIDSNGGVILRIAADCVTATWNAFRQDKLHETHAAICAHELNSSLHAAEDEFLLQDLPWAIAVTSGRTVVGYGGTVTERASIAQGPCVDLAQELLSLAAGLNIRVVVSQSTALNLQTSLCVLPVDVITIDDKCKETLYELIAKAPNFLDSYCRAFEIFAREQYKAAAEAFSKLALEQLPTVDRNTLRMLKLSILFSQLHTPYVRAFPAWQQLEGDVVSNETHELATIETANPHRTYKSVKRKSALADEQLRNELMTLHASRVSSTGRRSTRSATQLSPDSATPSAPTQLPSNSDLCDGTVAVPHALSTQRLSDVSAIPNEDPPPLPACRFSDRKGMLFCLSDQVLGRGATAEVILGMTETGTLVAVKSVPLPQQTVAPAQLTGVALRRLKRKGLAASQDTDKDIELLLTEVGVLSRLRHENIVGYLSSAIVSEKLYLVMEYVSGGSLLSLLKEFHAVPIQTAKRYLRDILRGLEFLHKEDIIHRDIKPHNVLMLIDGSCKLTDFGTSVHLSRVTGVNALAGTPQYMAPEAAQGNGVKASDIWSFGILMAQVLTGELPWEAAGGVEFVAPRFLYQLAHNDSFLPTIDSSIAPEAATVIRDCCQRDPTLRPTATDLLSSKFFASHSVAPSRRSAVSNKSDNDTKHKTMKVQLPELAPAMQLPVFEEPGNLPGLVVSQAE